MFDVRDKINFNYMYLLTTVALAFLIPLAKGVIDSFTILLSLIWLIEGNLKRKLYEIITSKLFLSFLAYLAFSLVSILWTNNLATAFNIAEKNFSWMVIFVLGTSLKKDYIQSVINAFLVGMLVSITISYGVFFEFWTFKNATPQNPTPIMNHIDYGVYLAFASIVLLNRIVSKHYSNNEKVIFTILFLVIIGNLFLIYGRTGQVALAVSIIVMTIIHFKLSIKSIALSTFLIFTIFTSAYNLSDSFNARVNTTHSNIQRIVELDFDNSLGLRAAYWITTFNIVKENPIFGVGLGDYIDETKKELEINSYPYLTDLVKKYLSEHHPHSQYLLVALQMGIIGLFLLFYLFFRILNQKTDDPEMKELSILIVTIFLISFLVEPLLLKKFPLSLFVLFIGLFASVRTIDHVNPDRRRDDLLSGVSTRREEGDIRG